MAAETLVLSPCALCPCGRAPAPHGAPRDRRAPHGRAQRALALTDAALRSNGRALPPLRLLHSAALCAARDGRLSGPRPLDVSPMQRERLARDRQ